MIQMIAQLVPMTLMATANTLQLTVMTIITVQSMIVIPILDVLTLMSIVMITTHVPQTLVIQISGVFIKITAAIVKPVTNALTNIVLLLLDVNLAL
jgi:hypothetical protein